MNTLSMTQHYQKFFHIELALNYNKTVIVSHLPEKYIYKKYKYNY